MTRTCKEHIACLDVALANERAAHESDRLGWEALLNEARAANAELRAELANTTADLAAAHLVVEELRRELGDEAPEPAKPAPRRALTWSCDCPEPRE